MPHEGRHVIEGAWGSGEPIERGAEPAGSVHVFLTPELVQQGVVLDSQVHALTNIFTEPRVDRAGVAAPEHRVGAPLGQVL